MWKQPDWNLPLLAEQDTEASPVQAKKRANS